MSKRPTKVGTEEPSTTTNEPELIPQEKNLINVYDVNTVKYTLDKAVCEIVQEQKLLKADNTISNLRIILGAIACSCAIYAYFQTSHTLILTLCGIYFTCGGIISYLSYFWEKNAILVTHTRDTSALRVASDFLAPKYTITVTNLENTGAKSLSQKYRYNEPKAQYKKTWSANELFDERGALDTEKLGRDISQLLKFGKQ